jgi:(p)ppGpp synthase/HD superfamily hydrolase
MIDRHGEHGLEREELTAREVKLLDRTWAFAIEHQGDQDRKGTNVPYTTHLKGVARRVLIDGGTAEEAAGALLHDVVEDTPFGNGHSVEIAEVRDRFGPRVAEVVEFCTDAEPGPNGLKAPWRPRKEAHFAHLLPADAGVLRVVAADKTDNITGQLQDFEACGRDSGALAESLARFKGSFAGTLWYYRGMRTAMEDKLTGSDLYEELTQKINEFAGFRKAKADEASRVVQSRVVLDSLDPCGVGPEAITKGYYAVDARELGRRASVPAAKPSRDIVQELSTQWYGEGSWDVEAIDRVAEALAELPATEPGQDQV